MGKAELRELFMADPVARALEVLNDALMRDADAITALVNARVPCNDRLARHPSIRIGEYEGVCQVGLLGLLNGILTDAPTAVVGAKGTRDERSGWFVRIRTFVDLRRESTDVVA